MLSVYFVLYPSAGEVQWAGAGSVDIYSLQQRCNEGQTQTDSARAPLWIVRGCALTGVCHESLHQKKLQQHILRSGACVQDRLILA